LSPQWRAGKQSALDRSLTERSEAVALTIMCGIDGCEESHQGPLRDGRKWRDRHHKDAHPGWEPPKRRRNRKISSPAPE
jgi:hypothetical protein